MQKGLDPIIMAGKASRAFGRDAARQLCKGCAAVDAAVYFTDFVALGMLSGCHEVGWRAGTGFQNIGFDNIERVAQADPSLSPVRCAHCGDRRASPKNGRGLAGKPHRPPAQNPHRRQPVHRP